MEIEQFLWRWPGTIHDDYTSHFEKVSNMFVYDWRDKETADRRAHWLERSSAPRADRTVLAHALHNYNASIGNVGALQSIQKLAWKESSVVIGGQQACLFTGPLLVMYKAVSIIRNARELSGRLNRPVLPVFWIAGEDHDFDEVDHLYYLSSEHVPKKMKIGVRPHLRKPVSALHIPQEAWDDALTQLQQALPDTQFKPALLEKLNVLSESCVSLSDYFARMLAWLFGKEGLIVCDAADPGLRRIESAMFAELIIHSEAINERFIYGTETVVSAGYIPQAKADPDGANVFIVEGEERLLLKRNNGVFTDKSGKLCFSLVQLKEIAGQYPEKLSNNVVTRPLMQEYLFPVLGVVLGPGEIAYWAQLRGVFETLKMQMPPIIPRMQATLVEGTLQKHMSKLELTFADIAERLAEKREAWLRAHDTLRLDEEFELALNQFQDIYEPLVNKLDLINPGLRKLGETNMSKIKEQIAFLRSRATDAANSKHEAALRQFERLAAAIIPFNKPQERVYNILPYLNRYGHDWLDLLIHTNKVDVQKHHIIYF